MIIAEKCVILETHKERELQRVQSIISWSSISRSRILDGRTAQRGTWREEIERAREKERERERERERE